MTSIDNDPGARPGLWARWGIGLTAVFLAAVMVAGIAATFQFTANERAREAQLWQTRLVIVSDTRAAAIAAWLRRQTEELSGLADNAALQLYVTQLLAPIASPNPELGTPGRGAEDQARTGYLSNLLAVVAHQAGFSAAAAGPDVNANVRRIGVAGILLVTLGGRVVAASPESPPLEGTLSEFLAGARRGDSAIKDIYLDQTGTPAMAFAVPLYTVQGASLPGNAGAAGQIGWVLGVKQVASSLYPVLRQPGAVWDSAEALLVRRNGNVIEYLSPTQEGDAPLSRRLAVDTPDLAARYALEKPGGFGTRRDYRGAEVLVTGRTVAPLSWAVVYKIGRAEALGPVEERTRRLAMILGLAVLAIGIGMVAIWRHGSSVRAARATAEQAALARRFEAQSRFLKLITDTQPNPMFIVDGDNRYRFANRVATGAAGISEDDVLGKTLASVLGPATAGDLRVVQAEHVRVPETLDGPPGVMVIEEDITNAVAERERRARTLDHLIGTLISILDRRDPYAAHHSARVSETAASIAREMGYDEAMIETVSTAGRLLNVGKIMVPEDVLTHDRELDDDQVRLVRESIGKSAEMLASVEFDGPVVDTLREVQRILQPEGATEGKTDVVSDDVSTAAQIVMAANVFIALTSDRAWRTGIDEADAAGRLMADSDGRYPRRVVSALLNLVDNKGLAFGVEGAAPSGQPLH